MLSDFDMLQNLQAVSTLQHNQKLCTTGKLFTVHDTGIWAGMWRTWYGEDRQANVARLQSLFALAMLRYEVLLLRESDLSLQLRIVAALKNALPGLERLGQTYRADVATASSISVLLGDVHSFLDQHSISDDKCE